LLVGKYRLSKRLVKDALSDMLGVELSVGSVSNLEGEISQALAPATAEALAYVRASQVASADETGFKQGREGGRAGRVWLWVVATALVVVFHIARNRNDKEARQLLGEDFAGFLTTDRWSAYEWVDALAAAVVLGTPHTRLSGLHRQGRAGRADRSGAHA
jgi:transposase